MQEGWFLSSAKVSPPTVTDKRVCMEGWARAQMCSGASSGGCGPGTSSPVLEKPLPAGGYPSRAVGPLRNGRAPFCLPGPAGLAKRYSLGGFPAEKTPGNGGTHGGSSLRARSCRASVVGCKDSGIWTEKKVHPNRGAMSRAHPVGTPLDPLPRMGPPRVLGTPRENWPWHRLSLLSWLWRAAAGFSA